jgi:hypothetical protein
MKICNYGEQKKKRIIKLVELCSKSKVRLSILTKALNSEIASRDSPLLQLSN